MTESNTTTSDLPEGKKTILWTHEMTILYTRICELLYEGKNREIIDSMIIKDDSNKIQQICSELKISSSTYYRERKSKKGTALAKIRDRLKLIFNKKLDFNFENLSEIGPVIEKTTQVINDILNSDSWDNIQKYKPDIVYSPVSSTIYRIINKRKKNVQSSGGSVPSEKYKWGLIMMILLREKYADTITFPCLDLPADLV